MIEVCGSEVIIKGRLVRIAHVHGDGYRFVDDPARVASGLLKCDARVDLFTFAQRLPESEPQFSYPLEWDNLAVLPITTFEDWWTKQIGF
jgi:hypothetical protein